MAIQMFQRFIRLYFAILYLGLLVICPSLDLPALREKAIDIWVSVGALAPEVPDDDIRPIPTTSKQSPAPATPTSESQNDYAELPMMSDDGEWATADRRSSTPGSSVEQKAWEPSPLDGSNRRLVKVAASLLRRKPKPVVLHPAAAAGHPIRSPAGSTSTLLSSTASSSGISSDVSSTSGECEETMTTSVPMSRSSGLRAWLSSTLGGKLSSLPRISRPKGTKRGVLNGQLDVPTLSVEELDVQILPPRTPPLGNVPFLPAGHAKMLDPQEPHQRAQMVQRGLSVAEKEMDGGEEGKREKPDGTVGEAESRTVGGGRSRSTSVHQTVERAAGGVGGENAAGEKARVWAEQVAESRRLDASFYHRTGFGGCDGPDWTAQTIVVAPQAGGDANASKGRGWRGWGKKKEKTEAQLEREALEKTIKGFGVWYEEYCERSMAKAKLRKEKDERRLARKAGKMKPA